MTNEHHANGDLPELFLFPRWANYLFPVCLLVAIGLAIYLPMMFWLGLHPETTEVGYAPEQPVAFSHRVHAGDLGMDCRYCHSTVETARFAAIPPTQTCLNCHASIKSDSELIRPIHESYTDGTAVAWKKVHDLPDFVYFNHSAHVVQGIGCEECHGRVDEMDVVYQHEQLSMSWCLRCHRKPEAYVRPRDQVTRMGWTIDSMEETREELGERLLTEYGVPHTQFMTSCTTCHR